MVKQINFEDFNELWENSTKYAGCGRFFSNERIQEMTKNGSMKKMKKKILQFEKYLKMELQFSCSKEQYLDIEGIRMFFVFDRKYNINNDKEFMNSNLLLNILDKYSNNTEKQLTKSFGTKATKKQIDKMSGGSFETSGTGTQCPLF